MARTLGSHDADMRRYPEAPAQMASKIFSLLRWEHDDGIPERYPTHLKGSVGYRCQGAAFNVPVGDG